MSTQTFVNLLVKDLAKSIEFFQASATALTHNFEDHDGHIWEPFYMDPGFLQK